MLFSSWLICSKKNEKLIIRKQKNDWQISLFQKFFFIITKNLSRHCLFVRVECEWMMMMIIRNFWIFLFRSFEHFSSTFYKCSFRMNRSINAWMNGEDVENFSFGNSFLLHTFPKDRPKLYHQIFMYKTTTTTNNNRVSCL